MLQPSTREHPVSSPYLARDTTLHTVLNDSPRTARLPASDSLSGESLAQCGGFRYTRLCLIDHQRFAELYVSGLVISTPVLIATKSSCTLGSPMPRYHPRRSTVDHGHVHYPELNADLCPRRERLDRWVRNWRRVDPAACKESSAGVSVTPQSKGCGARGSREI
jgi:hypothetical protein